MYHNIIIIVEFDANDQVKNIFFLVELIILLCQAD